MPTALLQTQRLSLLCSLRIPDTVFAIGLWDIGRGWIHWLVSPLQPADSPSLLQNGRCHNKKRVFCNMSDGEHSYDGQGMECDDEEFVGMFAAAESVDEEAIERIVRQEIVDAGAESNEEEEKEDVSEAEDSVSSTTNHLHLNRRHRSLTAYHLYAPPETPEYYGRDVAGKNVNLNLNEQFDGLQRTSHTNSLGVTTTFRRHQRHRSSGEGALTSPLLRDLVRRHFTLLDAGELSMSYY